MSDLDLYEGNLSICGRYCQILVKYLYIIRSKKKKKSLQLLFHLSTKKNRERSQVWGSERPLTLNHRKRRIPIPAFRSRPWNEGCILPKPRCPTSPLRHCPTTCDAETHGPHLILDSEFKETVWERAGVLSLSLTWRPTENRSPTRTLRNVASACEASSCRI